jgi:hypothetical protein
MEAQFPGHLDEHGKELLGSFGVVTIGPEALYESGLVYNALWRLICMFAGLTEFFGTKGNDVPPGTRTLSCLRFGYARCQRLVRRHDPSRSDWRL